jgi:C-3',4' desaturase CrtD
VFRTIVQNASPRLRAAGVGAAVDVAVVGGGLAGMATALRLQAAGLSTVVFEAHGHAGGCAGYWRHRGFSFDVGATTLVDFQAGGVGAELLDSVGMAPVRGEQLAGYEAWLPDRRVTLDRDPDLWHRGRLAAFGDDRGHRDFWRLLDRLADVFWRASRAGIRMPVRSAADVLHNVRAVGVGNTPLARYLAITLGSALRLFGLGGDRALWALLGMLVEDTVHSSVQRAPLINAALGITIRGAGLTRHDGGMHGFWRTLVAHYRGLGGELRTGTPVSRVDGVPGAFTVHTARFSVGARQLVLAVPTEVSAQICPAVRPRLARYLSRDGDEQGGAVVAFLGVPEQEVTGQRLTHHQLLHDYDAPLGDGNNMFVSVSAPGDTVSAPAGYRAVMLSTHTRLPAWTGLSDEEYALRKKEIGERLIGLARRAYPKLGEHAVVSTVATPRTFERFARRPGGAVGGPHQTLRNSNQFAVPHDLGGPGLWLVGDTTWPGLGTVACVLGSRIVADGVRRERGRL